MRAPAPIAESEIASVRMVSASRERVFAAWTDPEQWGPKGFTNTFHAFDPRPEGHWDFTMHGPNNMDFRNTCIFRRIVPPRYLEFDHLKEMHFYKAMITFVEVPGGTRIDRVMRFDTLEELATIRAFIERANEEDLDKLYELLNEQP